jgi:hypothetical protein
VMAQAQPTPQPHMLASVGGLNAFLMVFVVVLMAFLMVDFL